MEALDNLMFEKILNTRKKEHLERLNLYLISDRSRFPDSVKGDHAFLDHLSACVASGVKLVQLKENRKVSDRKVLGLAKALRAITLEFDALLIIGERSDIAKTVNADGVHLGQEDLDPLSVRKILGHEAMIGVSVHTQGELEALVGMEIDYLTAGPVFASEMVPGQPPVGLKFLQWMKENANHPWYAAGGIDFASMAQITNVGIARVALTRFLMASKNPGEDTQKLMDALAQPLLK
jgi:thiamine-phosphate pyrophosphorylase